MTIWTSIGEFFYGLSQNFLTIPRLLCLSALIIGYFFGLFQSAFILSKARHVDIYSKGSGNPGTTNMFRVMGAGFGILTFLLDIAKVVAAIFLTKFIFLTWLQLPIDPIALKLYTGLGAILGHNYPIYLRFKGGKGVAATCAVYACLGEWKYIIVGLVVFLLIFLVTRYVSLASMCTIIVLMFEFLLFTLMNYTYIEPGWLIDCQVIVIIFAVLVLITHRQNIIRLLYGEENRFSFRRKKEEPEEEVTEEEITDEMAEENDLTEEAEAVPEETVEEKETPAVPEEVTEEAEPPAAAEEVTEEAETPAVPKEYRTNHNKSTPQKKKKKHSTTKKKKSNGTKKKKK